MSLIIIDSTKSITGSLSGAITTSNPDFVVSYGDNNGNSLVENSSVGSFSGVAVATLSSSPPAGVKRVIRSISVYNKDTAPVTFSLFIGGTTLVRVTLQSGDLWKWGNTTYDSNGNLRVTTSSAGTATITGGSINNTVIGDITPAPATFSTLNLKNLDVLNLPTGGSIGTAPTTVDTNGSITLKQTTAGQTITIPAPTTTTAGKQLVVNNDGTASVIVLGKTILPGENLPLTWDGNSWDTNAFGKAVGDLTEVVPTALTGGKSYTIIGNTTVAVAAAPNNTNWLEISGPTTSDGTRWVVPYLGVFGLQNGGAGYAPKNLSYSFRIQFNADTVAWFPRKHGFEASGEVKFGYESVTGLLNTTNYHIMVNKDYEGRVYYDTGIAYGTAVDVRMTSDGNGNISVFLNNVLFGTYLISAKAPYSNIIIEHRHIGLGGSNGGPAYIYNATLVYKDYNYPLTITNGVGSVLGAGTSISIEDAAPYGRGLVNMGTQAFRGAKTFTDDMSQLGFNYQRYGSAKEIAQGLSTGIISAPFSVSFGVNQVNVLTLNANISTLSFSRRASLPTRTYLEYTLYVLQDATGGRLITSYDPSIVWVKGTPTLKTAGNSIDVVRIIDDGTTYWCDLITQASSGSGATNLSLGTINTTNVPINSSTGTGITTLPAATGALAGILTAGTQIIGGDKNFTGNTTIDGLSYLGKGKAQLLQTATQAGATLTLDFTTSGVKTVTLTANVTSVVINRPSWPANSFEDYRVIIKQDATGGRTITGWPATVLWPGGVSPVMYGNPNEKNLFGFMYDGTNYYGTLINGY